MKSKFNGGKCMINYSKFSGKLIRMNREYPIYSREDGKDNEKIGHTAIGDMAVITLADIEDEYFETVIVSGKYVGVDTLALNLKDIKESTFIFNKIDGDNSVYIMDKPVSFEYV